jgi:asparagine synthase (glutamine-hydrolysing)
MSGIYGIYRFDGAPVAPEWLERMRSAMAYYGPHGGANRIEDSIGLGHLRLEISPEDPFEKQPCDGTRGLVVSAARLDNRQELLDAFDIAPRDAPQTPDGELVSLGFDRWGEDVAIHLQGDWAMAGWNRRERRLFLARDAFGNSTFYFHQGYGFIAFASSLKALLALPGVTKEPDLLHLAQLLISWPEDAECTGYKNFRRLVCAQTLIVGARGDSQFCTYWSSEGRELLHYRREEEYDEAFLELYTRATRNCLRTHKPVSAQLSGGRDSGSVTAIAAPILAAKNRSLTAYTSIPCLPPDGAGKQKLGNEWDAAHATALMAGANVRHIAVDAADYGVLAGIEHHLNQHDGPGHAAGNQFWVQAVTELAARDGAALMLCGQMGNATVSWTGNGSALLALRERLPQVAWRLFLHSESNPWLTLKRQILKPIVTPPLRLLRRLQWLGRHPWQQYSALNPGLAVELDLGARMRAARYDFTFTFSPLEDLRRRFLRPAWTNGAGIWSEIGARHGLSILDPTANLALLEFLLRVPDTQFRRGGRASYLFRRAFRRRLPDRVLDGNRKGLQASDLGHRILRELPAFRDCLDTFDSHSLAGEVLDLPLLRRCLRDITIRIDPITTANARRILVRGVGVGMFLRRFA